MGKDEPTNPNIVLADPAKNFFVSMLIKDITLRDAIGDLVDNAVDAIKAKAPDPLDLSSFEIEIKLNKTQFTISDNGFGMEAKVARETAFNFGKSNSHKLIDKSIGQFGIGMKRAFFKIGNLIHVKSVAPTSQFDLTIDVPEWLKDPKRWLFEFDEGTLKEKIVNSSSDTGIDITISNLSTDSVTSFVDKTFIDTLKKEIALEHMLNINKGLKIKINDYPLEANQITLINDENIKPTYWEQISEKQSVKIIAGISEKQSEDGGWYIFCNDRLILAHNQGSETGWGDGVARYHAQYHRFRGYVFFEADDSSNLPWNTTKTGMDMDSPYYKQVRSKMIFMALQVFDLLNKLKEERENDNPEENQTLNALVVKSLQSPKPVVEVLKNATVLNNTFQYPVKLFNPPNKKNVVKINYQVSNENYEAVKQHSGKSSPKDVGLVTFNYYLENEL